MIDDDEFTFKNWTNSPYTQTSDASELPERHFKEKQRDATTDQCNIVRNEKRPWDKTREMKIKVSREKSPDLHRIGSIGTEIARHCQGQWHSQYMREESQCCLTISLALSPRPSFYSIIRNKIDPWWILICSRSLSLSLSSVDGKNLKMINLSIYQLSHWHIDCSVWYGTGVSSISFLSYQCRRPSPLRRYSLVDSDQNDCPSVITPG